MMDLSASTKFQEYWDQRKTLVEEDLSRMLGHDIILTPEEELVNNMLKKLRDEELENAFSSLDFLPSKQFLVNKKKIDESPVFQFIRKMPKGAVLHSHDIGISSVKWVVSELTYWDDLYMCDKGDGPLLFRFFITPDDSCNWVLVANERANSISPEEFDSYLLSKLSVDKINASNINEAWKDFYDAVHSINGILSYKNAREAYLYKAMEEHMNDNVSYMEMRSVLHPLFDKSGKEYDAIESFQFQVDVIRNFSIKYNDRFFGMRFIFSPYRGVPVERVWKYTELATSLRNRFPVIFAGFDLPGQEDIGTPLTAFIEPLLSLANQNPPMQFFFHSGETDWFGLSSDGNLYDSVLLNATRLGHAYALSKHPAIIQMAREKDIAVEVCPISNQIFKLVSDLRNHPAITLAADSFPMVVSSDTPAMWEALPLSHDFYEFFMMMGGKADLRVLKKLVLNSVRYSSLDDFQKKNYQKMLMGHWNEFIQQQLTNN